MCACRCVLTCVRKHTNLFTVKSSRIVFYWIFPDTRRNEISSFKINVSLPCCLKYTVMQWMNTIQFLKVFRTDCTCYLTHSLPRFHHPHFFRKFIAKNNQKILYFLFEQKLITKITNHKSLYSTVKYT